MVEGPTVRGCALGGAYTFDLCDTVVSDDNTEYVASTCTLVKRPSVTDMTGSAHAHAACSSIPSTYWRAGLPCARAMEQLGLTVVSAPFRRACEPHPLQCGTQRPATEPLVGPCGQTGAAATVRLLGVRWPATLPQCGADMDIEQRAVVRL